MKMLLMGATVLAIFALSVLLVQTSCSKTKAQQQRPGDITQLSKIIYLKSINNSVDHEIWTANSDGTNQTSDTAINIPADAKP